MEDFARTSVDAIRSLAKYLSVALGDEWEVRFTGEEHSFRLPFCLVAWAGPGVYEGRTEAPSHVRPVQIDCYPRISQDGTVEETLMMCEEIEEQLFQAFRVGVGLARPERVPFFNFAGVPLDGATSDRRSDHDFLRIVPGSLSFDRLADPQDERWVRVICTARLSWRRPGRRISGKAVESVQQEFGTLR